MFEDEKDEKDENIKTTFDVQGKYMSEKPDFQTCKNMQNPWDFEDFNMSCNDCITPFNVFNDD